jgi:hypothetical protein
VPVRALLQKAGMVAGETRAMGRQTGDSATHLVAIEGILRDHIVLGAGISIIGDEYLPKHSR